jgi:hypothetical protein
VTQVDHDIETSVRWFHHVAATWHLLFLKPHGSEYILPFVVAILPVGLGVYTWIEATRLTHP